MASLENMADKGSRKYRNKVDIMKQNYSSAKSRAISNYEDLPFGSSVTDSYRQGMSNADESYRDSIDRNSADKWKRNWLAKMRE